jgi:phenylalanyl-tRNA synthetase alpha chain
MDGQLTQTELEEIYKEASTQLSAVSEAATAELFRIAFLGKKGSLRLLSKRLGTLSLTDRKLLGARANAITQEIESRFSTEFWLQKTSGSDTDPHFDPTLPGYPFWQGSIHPLTTIRNEIRDIFVSMGFAIADGPEVESDYYNFEALNTPKHHPARDMQDTFYVTPDVVLRTHTSPVQIRVMEMQKPPLRCIMPGRVYRNEEISARSYCLFHQVEGICIDKNVSFADLKGTLLAFSKRFFSENTKIKIRPSFFPFVEPGVEVDVECFLCKGTGCSLCKKSGWLEILGAGMIHPNVMKAGNIDPDEFSGFAFGMGIERIALLKYGIDDIRHFYENDARFLRQL